MSALLIYNSNVATNLASNFDGETYYFQVGKSELLNPTFSIDSKIHSILTSEIEGNSYSAIFIPFSLSEDNYSEFIGLRFAFHIRLTKEFGNIQTPIIFYGAESAYEINKLTNLGSILFSRNIFTTDKISVSDFKKQIEWVTEYFVEIDEGDFLKDFISKNTVNTSGNYATHHSITNEWSIYRWAKALKIEESSIRKIEDVVNSNLYFKYLKAKFPVSDIEINKARSALESGKVLFIDDEIKKGWEAIFTKIRYPKSIDFLGEDFKNMTSAEIIETSINKVKNIDPDVVILDFRLHDDDFEAEKPENVTGYQILSQIKDYNKGIQVIVLSATNKIWNLLELQKQGVYGFIMKESPELSVDTKFTEQSLLNIYTGIEKALPKAKFLKGFVSQSKKMMELLVNYSTGFMYSLSKNLNVAFQLLEASFNEEKNKNYAYLQLFLILEEWLNEDSVLVEKNGNLFVDNGGRLIPIRKATEEENRYRYALQYVKNNNKGYYVRAVEGYTKENMKSFEDTMFKMSAVLMFKFGVKSMNGHIWQKISSVRNHKTGHAIKNSIVENGEIAQLIEFMLYLFNPDNFCTPEDSVLE